MKVSKLEDTLENYHTIYEREFVEELLEYDCIDVQEAAFMRGYMDQN